MEYLILTLVTRIKHEGAEYDTVGYVCVNSISRCKNVMGEDILQFVSSGIGQQVPMKNVISITPATPSGTAVAELRK